MRRWLLQLRYTAEGLRAIADNGGSAVHARLAAVGEQLGGKVEAFYFTLGGDYHAITIVTLPDGVPGAVGAWAGYLAIERAGLTSTDAIELVPPDVVDEAAKAAPRLSG